MAEQRPGFDLSRMSTASKILLGGSGLFVIISFFPFWQRVCASDILGDLGGFADQCDGTGLWEGVGVIAGLVAILILLMEVLVVANVQVNVGTPSSRLQIEAGLAGAVLLFTVLRIVIDNDFLSWGAWVGLILAVVIAYGGYMRWQESKVTTPPPSPGGYTA